MSMNPLPPQAYTKDTLLKAYQWLQNQTPNIRELATTPDVLVSLFLKASRDGESVLERPSIQNFKNELKNLAGLMGELDRPASPKPASMMAPPPPSAAMTSNFDSTPPAGAERSPAAGVSGSSTSFFVPPTFAAPSPSPGPTTSFTEKMTAHPTPGLDAKSLEMLKEIKDDFHLSHENEALRMLIKIGYVKAKGLLKDR